MNTPTKVIGIDPGMSKASTVCMLNDNNEIVIEDYNHDRLRNLLDDNAESDEKVLIAWDAPLTGIGEPNKSKDYLGNDFTQRKIEQFFSRKEYGYKTPKGISVLGYGGCPHWTITQHMLGYPIMGRHQKQQSELPYQLIHSESDIKTHKKLLVEVRPAVALWMWISKTFKTWNYKKDSERLQTFVNELFKKESSRVVEEIKIPEITTDDQLDAFIAFLLGYFLVNEPVKVMILGNQETGSFLLPFDKKCIDVFEKNKINV
jgi:hypothetical protein